MSHPRARSLVATFAVLMLLASVLMLPVRPSAAATPTDVYFSEYIEGSSNNKALEIYNGTGSAIDLAAGQYVVQMYFNGGSSAGLTINLVGSVASGDVFVLANSNAAPAILAQADQTNGSGWFNGDDAIVLRVGGAGGSVVDSIGQVGVDPGTEWGSGDTSTADNTLRRKSTVSSGDTTPDDAFDPSLEWDGFSSDTFDGLGSYTSGGGSTATATPVPPPVTPEPTVITPIGTIQGSVGDSDNGDTFRSTYAPASGNSPGQTVTVQGVIYQRTLSRSSSGSLQYGFFVQNTAATADADANSSDGIFVFMGSFTTLIGGYAPQVGDEVVIRGRVSEFFNFTQLSSASLVQLVRSGVELAAEVPAFEANPPLDLASSRRYWERREGMRAQIAAGSTVLAGRSVFGGTADAEVWVANPSVDLTDCTSPYAQRSFRDPHPCDNVPAELFDDGNGYRIIMGSFGIKGSSNDSLALLASARTFDTVSNAPAGGVYYSFSKYQVMVAEQLELTQGLDPATNAPPADPDRALEYSASTFNLENLYDFRDDPNDGCDFTGNSGCPGVNPPFDYVPASDAVYQARLGNIADQIISDLHSPDVLMVQEAEDQDICTVSAGALVCGTADDADGKPDTLQELATVIAAHGGPTYDAAFDRDGADARGIVSGFLYRTDRVQLLAPDANDPVLGSNPAVEYRSAGLSYNSDVQNPKALNAVLPADVDTSTGTDGSNIFTRAPQVGLFRIWRDQIGYSTFTDVYFISNHFSSGPDRRVGQRTEQAAYNAAIADAILTAHSDARVIIGGDFNVFPRPDDPFNPANPRYPSDQLGPLYNQGLHNLWDVLVAEVPASAYSYTFEGQAQTLDQVFVSDTAFNELNQFRAAHINADWPADDPDDGPRGTSDHDPQVGRYDSVSLERLEDLVRYYVDTGAITGKSDQLLNRLEKARKFRDQGKTSAYNAQLKAFAHQVQAFAPRFIDQAAADALVSEALVLRQHP